MTDTALGAAFTGRRRDEGLTANGFLSRADARAQIAAGRQLDNESRPHPALGWLTPQEFAVTAAPEAAA